MANLTYSKFVKQVCILGKKWDWDSVANVQCVDLAKAYFQLCFGIPTKKGQAVWGNACDYWNLPDALKPYFFKIPNTSDFKPIEGDVPIWGSGYSASHNCGHIAIANGEGNLQQFCVYEQNRDGKNCGVQKNVQTYRKDFKGVLRPYRYIKSAVNIRNIPSVTGTLLGEYPKGQKIEILQKSGNWYRTEKGWISANYVKEIGG